MSTQMPQEIEVWYVLPAIRRELAKSMIKDYKLSQKDTSKILNITESAVSQYVKSKRAKEVEFKGDAAKKIKEAAGRIIADNKLLMKEVYDLSSVVKVSKLLCEIHMQHDKTVAKGCNICLK